MKEWSDTLRELGNDSAHPKPGQARTDPKDARDVTQFLDFLLEYLYSLPHRIEQYRARGAGGSKRAPAPRIRGAGQPRKARHSPDPPGPDGPAL
jgi:hypothetical protein